LLSEFIKQIETVEIEELHDFFDCEETAGVKLGDFGGGGGVGFVQHQVFRLDGVGERD